MPYVYSAYSYDTNGNVIVHKRFNASGSDGLWFTDDDEVSNEWIMEEGEIANPAMLSQDIQGKN